MGVRLGLIGVLAAFIAAASVAAETPRALTVRIAQAPGVDRVVLGLSERIAFRAFTLADPARVVVDFPTVDWRLEATRPGPGFVLIDGLRFGLRRDGGGRMVIDLRAPAKVKRAFTEAADGAAPAWGLCAARRSVRRRRSAEIGCVAT